ncbi:30S ribosomal protein S15 [Candidatus Phytoplasma melaleucae]|uniref:30S ribosomal protein S15 n=1 Tax=Candidatus Phytoplasma melaleucae TaxID=2982630 RepID=A0ABT9DEK7_9MOLU|nr:30S ribosomal protein S15 ['Melaleuca sp.' phytoplasma]MDO8168082.1 30S ribosomal protein S15 ['Melaleuca sp.' phytoplasma]MDV3205363.1 30S ribosomal protein S15 [Weeping tea tree witches'-broom phytoplasma]
MALNKEQKQEIIEKNTNQKNNTGCTQVQIKLLSREIEELNKHFKKHPFDFQSKRGLLMKNKKRTALIKYLNKKSN